MGVSSYAPAQDPNALVYEMVLGPGNVAPETKPVLSTLLNAFPGSRIDFLREPTHLLIVSPTPLDNGPVGAALEAAGMRLIVLRDTATTELGTAPANEPFPLYVDTGNPDLDAATYDAEKSRWVELYPEAYEQLILSAP